MTPRKKTPYVGCIVVVHWFDAWRDATEDNNAEEILKTPAKLELEDVGFYIGERDGYIIISEERGLSGEVAESYRHIHRIPLVNVLGIKVIR